MKSSWRNIFSRHFVLFGCLAVLISLIGGFGFYYFETGGVGRAFWWVFSTLSTVGYGDVTPSSSGGRAVGVALMFFGVILTAYTSAAIATHFVHRRLREEKGLEPVVMENHTIIANWNGNANLVLEHLARISSDGAASVVLISEIGEDRAGELETSFPGLKFRYVHGNPSRDSILKRGSVERAEMVVVLTSSREEVRSDEEADSLTLKTVMGVRGLNKETEIYAEVRDRGNEVYLRRAGADEIISGDRLGGFLLAAAPFSPGLTPMLEELLGAQGNVFRTAGVPQDYVGKCFSDLFSFFRREKKSITLAIVQEVQPFCFEDMIEGTDDFVDAFIKRQIEDTDIGGGDLRRGRYKTIVNPPDDYIVNENDRVLIIEGARM